MATMMMTPMSSVNRMTGVRKLQTGQRATFKQNPPQTINKVAEGMAAG